MRATLATFPLVVLIAFASMLEARAADGYDHCTGFITPATAHVTTQGTWCLRQDLPLQNPRQPMVMVAANNVTIDCKGFRMGAVDGGGSASDGIQGHALQNVVVRNCQVIGINAGIVLSGDGIVVEDNVVRGSGYVGIQVSRGFQMVGVGNVVRRNQVFDTRGSPDAGDAGIGIQAHAHVLDNVVSGIPGTANYRGISASGAGSEVRGNRISGIGASAQAGFTGIEVSAPHIKVIGNHLVSMPAATRFGIRAVGAGSALCGDNTVAGFSTPFANCLDMGGNASH